MTAEQKNERFFPESPSGSRDDQAVGATAALTRIDGARKAFQKAVNAIRELGPSMSPGALAATIERNIETLVSEAAQESGTYGALYAIETERRRQMEVEGWSPTHDDEHDTGEMSAAAAAYAFEAFTKTSQRYFAHDPIGFWPWDVSWWKPTTPRRDLVKAAALILAEIERLDRAEAITPDGAERVHTGPLSAASAEPKSSGGAS